MSEEDWGMFLAYAELFMYIVTASIVAARIWIVYEVKKNPTKLRHGLPSDKIRTGVSDD